MRKLRFGRTGRQVSAVGLGTWGYSGAHKAGRLDVGWSGHDDALARAALVRAHEEGINHWDTADVYGDGQAERVVATAWDAVPRGEIFLATKVGWDKGAYAHVYHPDLIRERVDRSLELLRTDRVDLYYLHHCDFGRDDVYLDDAVAVLRRLRDEGKILHLGLSDWNSKKLRRAAVKMDPDAVQVYRNVLDDEYAASGLKSWAEERDVGVVFFSPLKHGLLLGKYSEPARFGDGDMRNRIPEFKDPKALERFAAARDELLRRFPDHPQAVLHGLAGALLADSPSGSVLVGQRNPAQAEAAATVGEALTADEAAAVFRLYRTDNQAD